MPQSSNGQDQESYQSAELNIPPRPTCNSGYPQTAASTSGETEKDRVAAVRVLNEKQPWISQYLKNPHVAKVETKTQSIDAEPTSRECHDCKLGNEGTDDTTADDTDSSAEGDIPFYCVTSREAPQMTNSPPAVAPQHPLTPTLSAITMPPPNSPTVHSDIGNLPTSKPIAACVSRYPPVPDANHPGETRNKLSKGPTSKHPKAMDSIGGITCRHGKACCGPHRTKWSTFLFHYT